MCLVAELLLMLFFTFKEETLKHNAITKTGALK
jgi:hypothetical protein